MNLQHQDMKWVFYLFDSVGAKCIHGIMWKDNHRHPDMSDESNPEVHGVNTVVGFGSLIDQLVLRHVDDVWTLPG